jgi:hypothetical protein
MQVGKSLSV